MAETKKSVQEVLAEIRKNAQIGTASEIEFKEVTGSTTGNISLDYITGVGGFPKGRVTEVFGPPSSGKTTSALQSLAVAQQRCIELGEGYVGYFDFEQALDLDYCRSLGIDVDHPTFILMQPDFFEQGANAFRKLLETGELRMGVFDSVAAMVTEKESKDDTGTSTVADRAKMMHQFMRQIKAPLAHYECVAIFINHTMDLVDLSFVGQRLASQGVKRSTQPGGKALPYYASLRIEFTPTGDVKTETLDYLTAAEEKQATSVKVTARAVKNKVGVPKREADLRIHFGKGFSQAYSVFALLLAHKQIKKSGAWFKFPDGSQHHGEAAAIEAIESSPERLKSFLVQAEKILATATQHVSLSEDADESVSDMDVDPETGEVLD